MVWWSLAFEDDRLGTVRHALKVNICPYARADNLLVLVRPILTSLVSAAPDSNGVIPRRVNYLGEVFYATAVSQPSHHPQFIVITVFEEATRDLLITCLADGVLFWCTP